LITVLGSLNMDLVALTDRAPNLGETVTGREFRTIPGGKGANQAVAAARAGGRVAMAGAVGSDAFGEEMVGTLRRDGIETELVRRASGASGTAHIVVDGRGQNAIIVIPGANGTVLGLTEADREQIRASSHLLMQLELPLCVVEEAAAVAHAAGVQVVLTPAPARALPASLLAHVDWLIPNEHEAVLLAGGGSPEAAAEVLLGAVRNVVVTLGARGCLWRSQSGETAAVAAPRVNAVDTTAAGDTFAGALAVALSEGRPVPDALRWACKAAAISVTRLGASPSMPTRREIEEMTL